MGKFEEIFADSELKLIINNVDNKRKSPHLEHGDLYPESNITDLQNVRVNRFNKQ